MKRAFKIAIILAGVTVLLAIAQWTGALKSYTIPTPSNCPNLPPGSRILASNLSSADYNDYVTYKEPAEKKATYLKRLIAKGGDTIEIINGVARVNRHDADAGFTIWHRYKLSEELYSSNIDKFSEHSLEYEYKDVVILSMSNETALEIGLSLNDRLEGSPLEQNTFGFPKTWTSTHFGPYIVPEGMVFLMGDNRENSLDSRYHGPIKEDALTGVVIYP